MPDYDLGTARGKIVVDGDEAVTGFGKAETASTNFTKAAKISGAIIAASGVAIAAGLGLAINSAANFEERMSGIAAVSGATGKELDKLRDKALQLGADTKFSATEAAGAIEELVKAGIPVADVLNGAADAAVNLAAAGEVDLATAATIAANALNAFNLSGQDMEHVADLIAGAANASAIDVNEFGQSLQQAGATANLVGLSFDDLAVAIAAMGNAGIKGSDAGTSLKTFLANLQPVTEKQIALFKDLGLLTDDMGNAFFDAQGKIKPMRDIAQTLADALAGQTDQQKALTLETLFGSDAIRAAAVIANEGAAGFDELAASMGKVSAEDVAETRMDNLRGSIEQLKGSLETLAIRFGTPLLAAIRGVVDFITKLANKFAELDPNLQKVIGIIAAVVAALLIFGGTILLLVGWLGTVAAAVGLGIGALLTIIAVTGGVVIAIVALIAAIVLLWRENETFRNVVMGVWNWLKENIPKAIDAIVSTVQTLIGVFQDVVDKVAPIIGTLVDEIMERWGSLRGWLESNVFPVFGAFADLVTGTVDTVTAVWKKIWPIFEFVGKIILGVITFLLGLFDDFVQSALTIWNAFGDNILSAATLVWNLIRGMIEGVLQIIRGIIQIFTGLITLDWNTFWTGLTNVVGGVWTQIQTIVQAGIDFVKLVIETAIEAIVTTWQIAWDLCSTILDSAWQLISNIIENVIGFIVGLIQGFFDWLIFGSIWTEAWNACVSVLSGAWEAIKNAISSAISTIGGWIAALPGNILSWLGDLGSLLYQKGLDLIQGFLNGLIAKAFELAGWFAGLPGKIIGWIGDLASTLYSIGKDLIQGLINGIKDKIGSVKDTLTGLAGSIVSWKGPPRKDKVLLEPIGVLLMEGLIKGLASQMDPLQRLLSSVGPDISDRLGGMAALNAGPVTGTTTTNTTMQFIFPNVKSAQDAEEIERALSQSEVLSRLLHATRAGVGNR